MRITELFNSFFEGWDLSPNTLLVLDILLIIILAVILDYLIKKLIRGFVVRLVTRTKAKWDDVLLDHQVFSRLAHVFPAILIQYYIPELFNFNPTVVEIIIRIMDSWIIFVFMQVLIAVTNVIDHYIKSYDSMKDKPTGSYFQLLKIIIYFFGGIAIVSNLFDKDPMKIIATFGALTAVLLLIFKDTILGFVASVQIAANDMIRIGDWISFPKYGADGNVLEITLNTVKVQNWDKTITTIPTYALVSDSFKNWRSMSESNARRIKRSIVLTTTSIKYCDNTLLEKLKGIDILSDFLNERMSEIKAFNNSNAVNTDLLINGRHLTNIGLFRYYVTEYLKANPNLRTDLTQMVFQLAQEDKGIPIQIYCFTNTPDWGKYENIQSDIFDHLYAAANLFELEIYQSPTSSDLKSIKL
ncbi:MAG: mechanosensitive ion channel family protein [Flavobacteriales bacterium]